MKTKKYLKQNELEFLSLYQHFKRMIKEGCIRNDDNARQFIEVLDSIVYSLNDLAQFRRETDELEMGPGKNNREAIGNCPVCLDVVPVNINGETRNSLGYYVNMLECKNCRTSFDDYLPTREDELLRWYENLFSQLAKTHEDGTYAEHINFPVSDLNTMRELYEDLKRNREYMMASRNQLDEIEETSEKQMKEVTEYLYMVYGQAISGNGQTDLN